jgi:hypothetical protein
MKTVSDIEQKTRLTAAETIGLQHAAKLATRTPSNLQRHLIRLHLMEVLDRLPADVRDALVREWDE